MDNIGIINFTWSFDYDDQVISLYNDRPEFKFNIADDYSITLLVTDENNHNDTDTIWVNVTDIEGPKLVELTYPTITDVLEDIEISIKISDISGIGIVKIIYNLHGSQYNVSMIEQNDQWQKVIPGQNLATVMSFSIFMSDSWGNLNKTKDYFIEIQDVVLPEISIMSYDKFIEIGENTTITASIFDNSEISQVKLNYTDIGGEFYNVTMNNTLGIEYSYELPKQTTKGTISFYIWAIDLNGNWNKTSTYKVDVIINISKFKKPEINILDLPTEIFVNSQINIIVKIIDDLAIKAVYLEYTDVNDIMKNVTMTAEVNNRYSYMIPGQYEIGTLSFQISAVNEMDIWNHTSFMNIRIIKKVFKDTIPPEVITTLPADNSTVIRIDTNVLIIFSERMNITQFKSVIEILPFVDFDLTWDLNDIELTLNFKTNLQYGTTYVITIGTSAKDLVGNGLLSSYILLFSTETIVIDKDGDGMIDTWELEHKLDPNNPNDASLDPDSDGLTNLEEFLKYTDPKNKDSDSDGLNDGSEIEKHNTDPNNPDSDGDNYNDGEEVISGSDPNKSDSIPTIKEDDDDFVQEILMAIIILIIVILILVFLLLKKSRRLKNMEEIDVSDEEEEEEISENVEVDEEVEDESVPPEDDLEEVLEEFESEVEDEDLDELDLDEDPEGLIADDSELIEE